MTLKATVTVTPDSGQSKVYGDLEPTLTWTASGLTNGDTDRVFTGALDRASGENVGTYAIGLGTSLPAPTTRPSSARHRDLRHHQGDRDPHPRHRPVQGLRRHRSDLHLHPHRADHGDTVSVFTGALDRASGENVGTYAIGLGTSLPAPTTRPSSASPP